MDAVILRDNFDYPVEVKMPKTYEEQVVIIKNKGFIVDNEDECIDFLHRANYYRLSAFFLPFKCDLEKNKYKIHFHKIERIYEFDIRLRYVLFRCIEEIELYLRTQFAYEFSHKYGTLGYLNPDNFSSSLNSDKFSEHIKRCINDNKNTSIVKHHMEKYNGQFPLWVVIEFFSMGMLSRFYADLKTEDQKYYAKKLYGVNPGCLKSWLRCITDLRNRCAHSSRLYAWSFTAQPKNSKQIEYRFDRTLFSQIVMLKWLYPEKKYWGEKVADEIKLLIEDFNADISLEHIGFPIDWNKILT